MSTVHASPGAVPTTYCFVPLLGYLSTSAKACLATKEIPKIVATSFSSPACGAESCMHNTQGRERTKLHRWLASGQATECGWLRSILPLPHNSSQVDGAPGGP